MSDKKIEEQLTHSLCLHSHSYGKEKQRRGEGERDSWAERWGTYSKDVLRKPQALEHSSQTEEQDQPWRKPVWLISTAAETRVLWKVQSPGQVWREEWGLSICSGPGERPVVWHGVRSTLELTKEALVEHRGERRSAWPRLGNGQWGGELGLPWV